MIFSERSRRQSHERDELGNVLHRECHTLRREGGTLPTEGKNILKKSDSRVRGCNAATRVLKDPP